MSIVEIKSDLSTKEFELVLYGGKYTISICAYGDWWDEEFSTLREAEKYLSDNWNFTSEQLQELKSKMVEI